VVGFGNPSPRHPGRCHRWACPLGRVTALGAADGAADGAAWERQRPGRAASQEMTH